MAVRVSGLTRRRWLRPGSSWYEGGRVGRQPIHDTLRSSGHDVGSRALGKGYAVDQAVESLRDAGVLSAFIHGGTSSSYGLGCPPDTRVEDCYSGPRLPTTLRVPPTRPLSAARSSFQAPLLAEVPLRDASLVSLVSGAIRSLRWPYPYGHVRIPGAASLSRPPVWPPWCCPRPWKAMRSRLLCWSLVLLAWASGSTVAAPGSTVARRAGRDR